MNFSEDLEAVFKQERGRSDAATDRGAAAFDRLLTLAEERDSGQIACIAHFIACVYDGETYRWDPFELRMLDVEISDDMLACLDALRWGQHDLPGLVPDGERRVRDVLRRWRLLAADRNEISRWQ
ncbi:hypothetical protein CKO44_06235 [Rubrivivax gelatinosus]|uniref:DUF7673 family protein n=1 Tax=Rubrivivax gelatinosus TaxID=28068 RepID=UPI0019054BDA|nr:hypothetical protein [Rubrivivax gelatinosus]MBK1613071.1 hypothetical protein [Rubrivivax gelatinosus]MBZ8143014.1 hypothetical protein [Rubrivivax gelatinosus]